MGFSIAPNGLESAAADMVKAGVDVIVCGGTGPTRAAQNATTSIPILTALDDFVGQKFASSISRPGGNVTGVSIFGPELNGKRQQLLLDLVPGILRIAALADPASTPMPEVEQLQKAAQERGVSLTLCAADKREEIVPAISVAWAAQAQAINVLASQLFNVNRGEILKEIGNARLPAIYQWPEWCQEGGLAAYGPRFTTVYRQLARQVAKILRGASPADLPVEQPMKFEFVINLNTAKAIGLEVPLSILANADEVIE